MEVPQPNTSSSSPSDPKTTLPTFLDPTLHSQPVPPETTDEEKKPGPELAGAVMDSQPSEKESSTAEAQVKLGNGQMEGYSGQKLGADALGETPAAKKEEASLTGRRPHVE
jgi:hypothetical protein